MAPNTKQRKRALSSGKLRGTRDARAKTADEQRDDIKAARAEVRLRVIASLEREGFMHIAEAPGRGGRACQLCGAEALFVLPLAMRLLPINVEDGTNVVCHPLVGGCGHGFAVDVNGDAP